MVRQDIALRQKLPYLIHLGLVEIRGLAEQEAPSAQIAKLADVLEFLPGYLERDLDPSEEVALIREQFEQYASQYPESGYGVRALGVIDGHATPTRY